MASAAGLRKWTASTSPAWTTHLTINRLTHRRDQDRRFASGPQLFFAEAAASLENFSQISKQATNAANSARPWPSWQPSAQRTSCRPVPGRHRQLPSTPAWPAPVTLDRTQHHANARPLPETRPAPAGPLRISRGQPRRWRGHVQAAVSIRGTRSAAQGQTAHILSAARDHLPTRDPIQTLGAPPAEAA